MYNGVKIYGYSVDEKGNVWSYKTNRFIRPRMHTGGYHFITLHNRKQYDCFIHRLVVTKYLENTFNKRCINHINGIKTDNRVENLEWCTDSENQIHSRKTGLHMEQRGENSINKKLNNEKVFEIRASNLTVKELSKQFNVTETAIRSVKRRLSWSHI